MFQFGEEKENLRNSDLCKLLKNYSQPTVKSTTSSTIDAISFQETRLENLDFKPIWNGIQLRHQFMLELDLSAKTAASAVNVTKPGTSISKERRTFRRYARRLIFTFSLNQFWPVSHAGGLFSIKLPCVSSMCRPKNEAT